MQSVENCRIGILGLGYVGFPLALEFGKQFETIGFDIDAERVHSLRQGEFPQSHRLTISDAAEDLETCNVFIVTVPTPVDEANRPDFEPLLSASKTIARLLKQGDIVIYESTVYPGTTEEVCIPVLENNSGLVFNKDFFCGYSPERVRSRTSATA